MKQTLADMDEDLTIAEQKIYVRLSFLQTYANGLVPDPSVEIPIERRAALKAEKEVTDARIDELEKLLKEMREN